jgi:hypothetical protein
MEEDSGDIIIPQRTRSQIKAQKSSDSNPSLVDKLHAIPEAHQTNSSVASSLDPPHESAFSIFSAVSKTIETDLD